EDGIRDGHVTGVQTCALPISLAISPFGVIVISTGILSGAQVATGSSGAFQTRSPPRSWNFSSLVPPSWSENSLKRFWPPTNPKLIILGPTSLVTTSATSPLLTW